MGKLERSCKIEFVPIGKMYVSEVGQRQERQYRVDALVSNFDIDRLGMPVLNLRDGRFYILDGQHRVAAFKLWNGPGWESVQLECQVFKGMSESEEAEMFLRLNDVLRVGAFDKFEKAVVAGRKDESAVKRSVEQQGLSISKHKTPNSIGSVSSLMRVYKRSNADTLGRALRIIRDAYGETGFEASVIDGIGHLCQRYNGALDEQSAKNRLGSAHGGVKGLLNRASTLQLKTGNSKSMCIAAAAVDIINTGKGGKKLPNWWKGDEA
jgi:hypothetical protein